LMSAEMEKDYALSLLCTPTFTMGAVVFILLVFHIVFTHLTKQPTGKEPPGPRPVPLLGNLLQFDLNRLHMSFHEMSKKYGSVFTVYLGNRKVVVLAGYKTIRDALVNHAEVFGDRDIFPIFEYVNDGHGILFANGDTWKEMRRFALSALKDFGMGKRVAEDRIQEECEHLIHVFESHKGKPFDTWPPLTHTTANVVSSIVYGSRFEYSDPRFMNLVSRANQNVRLTGSPAIQLYNMFPRLVSWVKNRQVILENVAKTFQDMKDLFKNLKETLDSSRGLVDCFLLRMQKEEDSCVTNTYYNERNLLCVVANLFVAGTDTTASTLRWALLLMAKYPHIQDQVQEELMMVVGSRQVKVEDRKNLPYTNAVIHEILRTANVLPVALPHKTSKDVTFQGHFIKKGTTVFPLLTSVLHDESEWESPHDFNPSHFLDEKGSFIRRDAFMPFSAGRRVCLGESLAMMELFIIFTSILHRFRFTPPPGTSEDELDLTEAVGFTRCPLPHELCAVSRF
uniref:Cytochrome P450 2K1-like n=1 Tax=Gouania willdenowi TaxID=441366 RepID=A0A8C5GPK5_GOUWI